MLNFKPDSQINNVSSQEVLQKNLWDALEKVIPDAQHEYNKKLELIKERYDFISYEDALKELGEIDAKMQQYVKNHIKGISHTKDISPEQCLYMKAVREDGSPVHAVIGAGAVVKYRADFFSPAYFKESGGNHDFNASELLGNLYLAVTAPHYPVSNVENKN